MRIAYLGPKGTFSESALIKYLQNNNFDDIKRISAKSIFDLFSWIQDNECDKIIVPIENSIEGCVTTSWDLMTHSQGITIEEEVILPISETLLGKNIQDINQITDIISHPQPLAQCQNYIKKHFGHITTHQASSTAVAVEHAMDPNYFTDQKEHKVAIIGNKELATIYNLDILAENINDYPHNMTRFFVLGKTSTNPTGFDKTSIVFSSYKDRPGGLYEALGAFSNRKINLTKISSRPTKEALGEYWFFLDLEGHMKDQAVSQALKEIESKASFFKILGSYKRGKINDRPTINKK